MIMFRVIPFSAMFGGMSYEFVGSFATSPKLMRV